MTRKMYKVARKLTKYKDFGSYDSRVGSYGCYREYCMYNLKVPSITIEVGYTKAPNSKSEYGSIIKKNKYVVLGIAAL